MYCIHYSLLNSPATSEATVWVVTQQIHSKPGTEAKYRVQQDSFLFPSDRSVQKRKLACRTLYNSWKIIINTN
jgi:hypothetical protein